MTGEKLGLTAGMRIMILSRRADLAPSHNLPACQWSSFQPAPAVDRWWRTHDELRLGSHCRFDEVALRPARPPLAAKHERLRLARLPPRRPGGELDRGARP